MNWRRGLFQFWLVGTLAWMVIWLIMVRMACHLNPDGRMRCEAVSSDWIAEWIDRTTWTYLKIGLVGLAIPALVLVVGAVVVWARSPRA
jgi:hypothetical protein